MGISLGGSKSRSRSNNGYSFSQDIPRFQQTALAKLYDNSRNLYGQTANQQTPLTGPTAQKFGSMLDSALPVWNNALKGGVYDTSELNRQLGRSLDSTLNTPSNTQQIYSSIMGGSGNNYADAMKSAYMGDANRATDNMLANLDARAAASGMSGGARHGTAIGRGMYDINSNLQRSLAETGYNTFDKDLGNKLNIAQQADQNTLQRQQMLQQMLGSAQDTQSGALTQLGQGVQNLGMGQFAPFMAPWEPMNNYAAVLGSPTVLSSGYGSGSGSGKGKGLGFSTGA